jgi:hypothetical protein
VLGIQSFSMDRMLEMDPDFLVNCQCSVMCVCYFLLLWFSNRVTCFFPG